MLARIFFREIKKEKEYGGVRKKGWLAGVLYTQNIEQGSKKEKYSGWLATFGGTGKFVVHVLLGICKKKNMKKAAWAKKREELNFSKRSLSKMNL